MSSTSAPADAWLSAPEDRLIDVEKTFAIRSAILAEEKRIRAKYDFLKYQDEIGLSVWLLSILAMLAIGFATWNGLLAWYAAIPLAALPASVLHELEHDLIHKLYFRTSPAMIDLMFTGIWLAKLSLNPWARQPLHMLHHKRSGQPDDVEERLIGNGQPNLLLRLAVALFPPLTIVWIPSIRAANPAYSPVRGTPCSVERLRGRMDLLFYNAPLWVGALALCGGPEVQHAARTALAAWILPNTLRHVCIVLMSSFSHYYGDVTPGVVSQQNQILRHWALLPLQAFSCNFGAEHVIHHYVVAQPFYIRSLCAHEAWRVLIANGTRLNDWGTIWRANRYGAYVPSAAVALAGASWVSDLIGSITPATSGRLTAAPKVE